MVAETRTASAVTAATGRQSAAARTRALLATGDHPRAHEALLGAQIRLRFPRALDRTRDRRRRLESGVQLESFSGHGAVEKSIRRLGHLSLPIQHSKRAPE